MGATKKENTTETTKKAEPMVDVEKLNIYQKLQFMRVELQNKGLTKSGYNDHKKYAYFELADFLPAINDLQKKYGTITLFEISKEEAALTVLNCSNTKDNIQFSMPVAELSIAGANSIQNIGGLTTYCRRYLYMIAFEIAENDEFDGNANNEQPPAEPEVFYVDAVKIKVLKDNMKKKGVTDNQVLEICKVSTFEEITVQQFMSVMKKLEKTPDVEDKQVDLGL
jgi:hypothetical protein